MSRLRSCNAPYLRTAFRHCNGAVAAAVEKSISSNPSTAFASFHSSSELRFEASRAHGAGGNGQEEFDPTEQRTPPSEKLHRLADQITGLNLLEVLDLSSLIKKKLGLPDIPLGMQMMPGMMPGMAPGAIAGGTTPKIEEKEPEKTAFDVKLESYDASAKIKIIKEVRGFTSLGLKEAKELVEKTPAFLKKGVSKEEALQIVEKIKAAGGTAVME